jgi:hypothetical protein
MIDAVLGEQRGKGLAVALFDSIRKSSEAWQ